MAKFIISSILFGASISKIISDYLVYKAGINFYSTQLTEKIPGFTEVVSTQKTFDNIYVLSIIIFAFLTYLLVTVISKIRTIKNNETSFVYFIFSALTFLETHFVAYSGIRSTLLIIFIHLFCFFLSKFKSQNQKMNFIRLSNGLFLGFYLLVLTNLLTTSFAIPLGIMLTMPFLFNLISNPKLESVQFIFFPVVALFPFNKMAIMGLGFALTLSIFVFKENPIPKSLQKFINKIIIVLIFVYNPLFYFGNFDSIEEGFWLGWQQRLLNGEIIYKDFAAYHPPILLWGLNFFNKLFGQSIYNLRGYLHILQIFGSVIIFLTASKLVKNTWLKIAVTWLILSLLSKTVQNNVEIRLGLGLLAMLPIYSYLKNQKATTLLVSGILTAVSIFVSLEVGLISFVSISILLTIMNIRSIKQTIKTLSIYVLSTIITSSPVVIYLSTKNALAPFVKQMIYYTNAFSNGYLNSSISWPENLSLLQWHIVNRFFSSATFLWYIILGGVLFASMVIVQKAFNSSLKSKDYYLILLIIFSILMIKPVLGRSDSYHLLFSLPLSLILFFSSAEYVFKNRIYIPIFIALITGLFFVREATQLGFLQSQMIKFQTYANAEGQYPSYKSDRTNILVGIEIDTKSYDELITYLKENTTKEDFIFTYPQRPEIYFLTNRKNATSFDTPLAYFTDEYQFQMISELKSRNPKYIVYDQKQNLGNLNAGSLPKIKEFIEKNYKSQNTFGDYQVMTQTK